MVANAVKLIVAAFTFVVITFVGSAPIESVIEAALVAKVGPSRVDGKTAPFALSPSSPFASFTGS